jgi:hypothetical protein
MNKDWKVINTAISCSISFSHVGFGVKMEEIIFDDGIWMSFGFRLGRLLRLSSHKSKLHHYTSSHISLLLGYVRPMK